MRVVWYIRICMFVPTCKYTRGFVCVCVCVCFVTYMCVCVCVYMWPIYIYIHTYMYTYSYIHTHTSLCTQMNCFQYCPDPTYVCVHIRTCVHTQKYEFMHMHTHTNTHTYIYTYIHMYIHAQECKAIVFEVATWHYPDISYTS